MRLNRFLVDINLAEAANLGHASIADQDIIHQMLKVLRLQSGNQVILIDGMGSEFLGTIEEIDKKSVEIIKDNFIVYDKEKGQGKKTEKLIIAISILKKDKFEWVLQKTTELGVDEIVPIISDRTEKVGLNFERANLIIKEAVEQSGRVLKPVLHESVKLEDFVKHISRQGDTKCFALDFSDEELDLEAWQKQLQTKKVAVLVGPEGGFSGEDHVIFGQFNIPRYKVGELVLRAETAAVSITTLLKLGK